MMKSLFLLCLLNFSLVLAQGTGTGSGNNKSKDQSNDKADDSKFTPTFSIEKSCLPIRPLIIDFIDYYNGHPSVKKKDRITNLQQFDKLIEKLVFKIHFKLLKDINKDTLIKECGKEKVDKILQENKWLEDPQISRKLKNILKESYRHKCTEYPRQLENSEQYMKFLELWLEANPDILDEAYEPNSENPFYFLDQSADA